MKDRRNRPNDINNGKTEIIYGTIKLSKDKAHAFIEPNDPTYGLWRNFNLEDFCHYWEMPLYDSKYCYFSEINFGNLDGQNQRDIFPIRNSVDEAIVENGKERHMHLDRNYRRKTQFTTGLAAFFGYLFYLAA
jgi:hypothetical protein